MNIYYILIDIILIAFWYLIYNLIFRLNDLKEKAFDNAKNIICFEKKYNFFYEENIHKYMIHQYPKMFNLFNFMYIFNHAITTIGLLVYVILIRNDITNYLKTIFYAGNVIGLLSYYFYPVMPPRLLNCKSKYGGNLSSYNFNSINIISDNVNNYGAMPSLHIFFSLWFSHSIYILSNSLLALIHPLLTFLTIIITGHHYIVDAIAGTLLYLLLLLYYYLCVIIFVWE